MFYVFTPALLILTAWLFSTDLVLFVATQHQWFCSYPFFCLYSKCQYIPMFDDVSCIWWCLILPHEVNLSQYSHPMWVDDSRFFFYPVLVGGLEHEFYVYIYWECHHPNWPTPSLFRGVGSTTNQMIYSYFNHDITPLYNYNKQWSYVYITNHWNVAGWASGCISGRLSSLMTLQSRTCFWSRCGKADENALFPADGDLSEASRPPCRKTRLRLVVWHQSLRMRPTTMRPTLPITMVQMVRGHLHTPSGLRESHKRLQSLGSELGMVGETAGEHRWPVNDCFSIGISKKCFGRDVWTPTRFQWPPMWRPCLQREMAFTGRV